MIESKSSGYFNYFEYQTNYFLENIQTAKNSSYNFFEKNEELKKDIQRIFCFHDVLDEVPSSDFGSISKHQHFFPLPYKEAQIRLVESLNFAICGLYKSAYDSLRSYYELIFLGIYQSTDLQTNDDVNLWITSQNETPRFSRMLDKLISHSYFQRAEHLFKFKSLVVNHYWKLCDYSHTRGENFSYLSTNLANFPRFIEKSLIKYVTDCLLACDHTAVGLALAYPVIIKPLPLTEKFGIDGPISGFLEYDQVASLKEVIDKERLRLVEEIVKDDDYIQAVKSWVYSLNDLSDEELEIQFKRHREMLEQIQDENAFSNTKIN